MVQARQPVPKESELKIKSKQEKPKSGSPASSISDRPKRQKEDSSPQAKAQRTKKWRDQFGSNSISPETLRQTIDDLLKNRQFEEVIACLEQAIIHGKIEPWMYEILAYSMEITGRPKNQVERVLLSSQDLITADVDSMMVLAAHLTRFGRNERAIELYRQASHLAPERPEPFLQGLTLARKTRNADAVAWSAPEVRALAWGSEQTQLRREVEQAASDAIHQFTRTGQISRALKLQDDMLKARSLDLVVRLDWNGKGDLDLVVKEPSGEICSADRPTTVSGGVFLHDGFGSKQANCFDEYLCPKGDNGEYQIKVRHVWGEIVGKRARLTIIRGKDTPYEQTENQTVLLGVTDPIVRISLSRGRRTDGDTKAPTKLPSKTSLVAPKPTKFLAQTDANGQAQAAAVGSQQTFASGNIGYQPVIVQINEGVTLTALAVVSADRRYVRMSVNPTFTNLADVFSFSFANSNR